MPSAFRDKKTLSDWIQLDYFRRPRSLRAWRAHLGWGTLTAVAAGVAVIAFLPRGKGAFQAGPVSSAHAMFNNDCGQCHTEAFQTAKRLVPVNASAIHAVPNAACEKCHDGPPHNQKQLTEQACADCHREHRGRLSLSRVGDDHCTACHADLKENSRDGPAAGFQDVRSFPGGHPEFRLWRDNVPDTGRLYFNHKVHLKLEGVPAPGGKAEVLDCSNCHRPDAAGRFMRPIEYYAHCARCHALSVQLAGPFADEQQQAAAAEFAREPAPHKEPAIVRAVLRERLIRFVQQNPVLPATATLAPRVPRPRRLGAIDERQWAAAKRLLTEAEKLLFSNAQLPHEEGQLFDRAGGCAYCHVPSGPRGAVPRGPDDLPVYEPTSLPARWLTHARFGHDSHRMLACTECHQARDSSKTSDVLLPKLETCARCHDSKAGVRHDCVECHAYHHRDERYEASKGRTIAEALGK
jgi:hypothetical protein